jgi:ADP-heptose:LPS heptosyltransferase
MSLRSLYVVDRYLGVALIIFFNVCAHTLGMILKRDHSLPVKGDILVIKMLGGGSLVMAIQALLGIRRAYPNVKMRLFTTSNVKPFAETFGIFDEIVAVESKSVATLAVGALRCIAVCFGNDTVIDLEVYSYLSTVLSLLTCARNRIGFFFEELGFRERLHTHRIFFQPGSPLYRHYDRMATLIGAEIASTADCRAQVKKTLGITEVAGPRVAVGCGCSDLAHERKLGPDQWAQYVFAQSDIRGREAIFLGAQSDYDEAEKVKAAAAKHNAWNGKLDNRCGALALSASLRTLASCEEFWGIDSSLLHYARLFGLRCKSFFGPTHPMRLRPVEGLAEQVYYRNTICSPCIHLTLVPPCHSNNVCMQWLFDKPVSADPREDWIPVSYL